MGGASSFTTGGFPITLTDAGNDFTGAVTLSNSGANDLSIRDANDLSLNGFTTGGSFTVQAGAANTATLLGAVAVAGSLTIAGGTLDSGGQAITVTGNWDGSAGAFTAGAGTVTFNGTGAQTVHPGTSAFNNLIKQGGSRLTALAALAVTGTLTIGTATDIVDVNAVNLTVGTLVNNGTLELDGTQTQAVTTMDTNSGTVLYNGAAGGVIGIASFFDLTINGAGTFTLGQPITTGTAAAVGNLTITAGVLDVTAANHQITVYGDWINTAGAAAFVPRQGTVVFAKPAGTVYVWGSNNWYVFECMVPGLTIAFEAARTQTMVNVAAATFRVHGALGNNVTLTSFVPPAAPPAAYPGDQWLFTLNPMAGLDMQYVTVNWSNSTPYNITVPALVTIGVNCDGWLNTILVIDSYTEDWDNNGKIDRIRVQAQANINDDFSDFTARVQGYQLASPAYDGTDPALAADEFWILLQEKPGLDTDATPQWWIDNNTSLRDSATGTYLVVLNNPIAGESPRDQAAPTVGYTLAVAGWSQIFVAFSEPVQKPLAGGQIDATDFTYSGGASVTGFTKVSGAGAGTTEALLTLSGPVTAAEVYAQQPLNTTSMEDFSPAALALFSTSHRVTDVALGPRGDGIVEPVWAHDETLRDASRGGIGMIRSFDGSEWLRAQTITLQAHINNAITANPTVTVHWDSGVDAGLKTGGLWLPTFTTSDYNGLVPYPDTGARSATGSAVSTQLRDFTLPAGDPALRDGATVELFFRLPGAIPLYAGRLQDYYATDWYRKVRPWSFDIHDVIEQRGTVTILNNVINPLRGESASLFYRLTGSGYVTIQVFTLAGDIVDVLYRGTQDAGEHTTSWGGRNRAGQAVARGVYIVRLVGPGIDEFRKILVVK